MIIGYYKLKDKIYNTLQPSTNRCAFCNGTLRNNEKYCSLPCKIEDNI